MPIQLFYNVGPLGNNVYVIYDQETKDALLVDPALQSEPVWEFLEEQKLRLTHIVNTHGHMDHVAKQCVLQAPGAPRRAHVPPGGSGAGGKRRAVQPALGNEGGGLTDSRRVPYRRHGDHGGERSATGSAHTGPHSRRLLIGDKRRCHHRRHPVPELRWPMRPARRVDAAASHLDPGALAAAAGGDPGLSGPRRHTATSVRRKRTTPFCTRRRSGRWGCYRKKCGELL